jgi:hypothetical protein
MNKNNDEPQSLELEIVTPTALESLERANVDMQIATAKRYPRSPAVVKKRMMDLATLDQESAATCFYRLNRQGKMIEGPTIRLAEIAGSCFGNLRYGARVIGNDGKVVTAQGYCFDLETNVMSQVEVQRRITDRNGNKYSEDMQVVTGNAACAIALRNAVFKVVPFAIIKPIFTAAKKAAVGDIKTLVERRTAMLAKFASLGINEKRILTTLGKNGVDEIGLAELETLIGLHNAIEDKEQTVEEAFPSVVIERPVIATPKATQTNQVVAPDVDTSDKKEDKKPIRKKVDKLVVPKEEKGKSPDTPHPNADALQVKLTDAGVTLREFYDLADKMKWMETTPVEDLPLREGIDEDRAEVFLDSDNWRMFMEQIEKSRNNK